MPCLNPIYPAGCNVILINQMINYLWILKNEYKNKTIQHKQIN